MSVHPAPPGPVANGRRRCRQRPIAAGSPRPSELLRLFFLTGLLFIAASALAGIADAAAGGGGGAGGGAGGVGGGGP